MTPFQQSLRVALKQNPYEVLVGEGILATSGEVIRRACGGGARCAIITDAHVGPLYADTLMHALSEAGVDPLLLTVPAGEASKSFARLEELCQEMSRGRLDRTSFVVALGGGVVGDLAGFAAAIFLRGLPCAQVPTTILAHIDSSVGGKTGINIPSGKNLVGAFHQPKIVIADTATLTSLPDREFREGMAECIKHGVIRDRTLVVEAPTLAKDNLPELVARNVRIKAAVVADDEFERTGQRAHLNFGHTLGHAIEQAAGYGCFLHGEAISIGMVAALRLSVSHAGLPKEEAGLAMDSLKALSLPTELPSNLAEEALLEALFRDKKFEEGRIRFVLTPSLGSALLSDQVTVEDIRGVLRAIRGETSVGRGGE